EKGKVTFAVQPAEFHYNPIGVVHGGLAATLCDSAMGCAVQTMLPAGTGYTTVDLSVTYLCARSARSSTWAAASPPPRPASSTLRGSCTPPPPRHAWFSAASGCRGPRD